MRPETTSERRTLFYFHDPMCSWCWAFRPVWTEVRRQLPDLGIDCRPILGGLAPDTLEPMPRELRVKIQGIWRTIQQVVPGTRFNFDFWEHGVPRRATYPACRAVIAARRQGAEFEEAMILAIQQAYYLEARNPSDEGTLIELAGALGLDATRFTEDLRNPRIQNELLNEIRWTRGFGVTGFPSLILSEDSGDFEIPIDYRNPEAILRYFSPHG